MPAYLQFSTWKTWAERLLVLHAVTLDGWTSRISVLSMTLMTTHSTSNTLKSCWALKIIISCLVRPRIMKVHAWSWQAWLLLSKGSLENLLELFLENLRTKSCFSNPCMYTLVLNKLLERPLESSFWSMGSVMGLYFLKNVLLWAC